MLRYKKALPNQFFLATITSFRDHSEVMWIPTNRNQLLNIHLIRCWKLTVAYLRNCVVVLVVSKLAVVEKRNPSPTHCSKTVE